MQEKEQVLVFPSSLLDGLDYLGDFAFDAGIQKNLVLVARLYRDIFSSGQLLYMDRKKAEADPSFKQIIPYVVLYTEDYNGACVLGYKRTKAGGEGRLHEKWSIGVGGHINPADGAGNPTEKDYTSGLQRELEEETGFRPYYVPPLVALIYDDSNDVGKVHFGVVHIIKVDENQLKERDEAVSKLQWCTRDDLNRVADRLENWSKLVLEHVKLPV